MHPTTPSLPADFDSICKQIASLISQELNSQNPEWSLKYKPRKISILSQSPIDPLIIEHLLYKPKSLIEAYSHSNCYPSIRRGMPQKKLKIKFSTSPCEAKFKRANTSMAFYEILVERKVISEEDYFAIAANSWQCTGESRIRDVDICTIDNADQNKRHSP